MILYSLHQKGANRFIYYIKHGKFKDALLTSYEVSSYGGLLMSFLQQVAREDLPVSRYGRDPQGEVIASYDAEDPGMEDLED
jgi:hypothetical protein